MVGQVIFSEECVRECYSWSWNYATVTTIRRREQRKIFQSSSDGGTWKVVWNLLAWDLHKSADRSLSDSISTNKHHSKVLRSDKSYHLSQKKSLCSAITFLSGLFTRGANNEDLAIFCTSSPRWITKYLNEGQRVEQGSVIVRWQWRNDTPRSFMFFLMSNNLNSITSPHFNMASTQSLKKWNIWKLSAAYWFKRPCCRIVKTEEKKVSTPC